MIEYSELGHEVIEPAEYGPEGEVTKPPVFGPAYLVNVTLQSLPPELESKRIYPDTPTRVFGGCETAFLQFDSREEWLAYLPQE